MADSRVYAASSVALGAALAGVAFGAAGGTELGRTSVVEVLTVLACGALLAIAVHRGASWGPGAGTLALFAALAVLTALSVTWSVIPGLTYVEAGRTLCFLLVFAAGVALARLAPRAPQIVLGGVMLAALAVVGYALASRVWPESLAANEASNRIGAPFQYWNAVGTTAALTIPALLWLGSRRTGPVALGALAYPAAGACILAILLTQSRGALGAAVIGAIGWFAIVPLRLRSVPVLLVPAAVAGAVGAWALSKDAFSETLQPPGVREAVAGDFGLLVLLMLVVLLLAGIAVHAGLARSAPPMRLRRRAGVVAVALACLIPLAGLTSVAMSDRGLAGTIDDGLNDLTSESDTAPEQGAARLTAASSTRGKYWREAGRIFDGRPLVGVGAGGYEIARLHHRKDASVTRHAHGYVAQTIADLGLLGMALSLALLGAWLAAAARATGLIPRRFRRSGSGPPPRGDWTSARVAMVALALVAIVFGLQSTIDWTWFVPGPTALALVAAGYLAGSGPLSGQATPSPAASGPPRATRTATAAGVAVAAAVMAWAIWQPQASARSVERAAELADAGDYGDALSEARAAEDSDPLSPDPLFIRAEIQTAAGLVPDATETLEDAVLAFPGDPQTWIRLARFQLGGLDRPRDALETLRGALWIDPYSPQARQLFLSARARQREKAAST